MKVTDILKWAHDIQHNDTRHNDIQQRTLDIKGPICDEPSMTLSITAIYHYGECHDLFIFMLNLGMLSVKLSFIKQSVVAPLYALAYNIKNIFVCTKVCLYTRVKGQKYFNAISDILQ